MIPVFKRKADGLLLLSDSLEAMSVKREQRQRTYVPPKAPSVVRAEAEKRLQHLGGDVGNGQHLLGQFKIQFGAYRNETFLWLAENALGYIAYLVASIEAESASASQTNFNWVNKMALKKYLRFFPEGNEAIALKSSQLKKKARTTSSVEEGDLWEHDDLTDHQLMSVVEEMERKTQDATSTPTGTVETTLTSTSACSSCSRSANVHPSPRAVTSAEVPLVTVTSAVEATSIADEAVPSTSVEKTKWSKRAAASVPRQSVREVMFSPPKKFRSQDSGPRNDATSTSTPDTSTETKSASRQEAVGPCISGRNTDLDKYPIYAKWRDSLPEEDVKWISQALFTSTTDKRGERAHMLMERVNKMWWHPPEPPFFISRRPNVEQYFGHRLFLWMPHKLWHVRLTCPHDGCEDKVLTAAGVYNKLRTVVDISSTYLLASEYMACPGCKRKVISWSWSIIQQLDISKQRAFPCILTAKKACDLKVVRLLRERSLGNSSSQAQRILVEQHSEEWLSKNLRYLADCKSIQDASSSHLVQPVTFQDPPKMLPVPQFRWLIQVYVQDVLMRLSDVKAEITSTFGRILKMDSTKKVVNKLAGPIRGTAMWATNVGNEVGQVLISVITTGEGHALIPMAEGIMARYQAAGVPPPEAFYVDRDCCGSSPVRKLFHLWKDIPLRLDIWHFMRRIAGAVTSESHMLYAGFMNQLSHCIFMWDSDDLEALKAAKFEELRARDILPPTKIMQHISRQELALHCRRTTRGADETGVLIRKLLDCYKGAVDTLGVPLLKDEAVAVIWDKQQRHLPCIQDPPGVPLYLQTGTLRKGGKLLPTYRCARGSTSLESFHLHQNMFIPGTLANEVLFQAYFVEGLARWNQNRAASAREVSREEPVSYNHSLRESTNLLSESVLGKKILPSFQSPGNYTGEKIGLEYLHAQTGRSTYTSGFLEALENGEGIHPDMPATEPQMSVIEDVRDEEYTVATLDDLPMTTGMVRVVAHTEAHPSTSLKTAPPVEPPTQPTQSADIEPPASTPLKTVRPAPPVEPPTQPTQPADIEPPDEPLDHPVSVDNSVGPDNLPGYAAVQNLAEYLMTLADGNLSLTTEQSGNIIRLWNALSAYDQRRTNFQERFSSRGYHKFRAPKILKHPGVQSLECSVRAPDSITAAKPDCNRYVEALVQRLCQHIRTPKKKEGTRWSRIMAAYNTIQTTVLNNATVMEETAIQLPFLSQQTLRAWYNNKLRSDTTRILQQGLDLPDAPLVSEMPLLPPVTEPNLDRPSCSHVTPTPPNTAGLVIPKTRRLIPAPSSQHATTSAQSTAREQTSQAVPAPVVPSVFQLMIAPSGAPLALVHAAASSQPTKPVHYQTAHYRKVKEQEQAEGKTRRAYHKTKAERNCKKCGEVINSTTHKNLWGALYCPSTSTEKIEEFTRRRYAERQQQKKK